MFLALNALLKNKRVESINIDWGARSKKTDEPITLQKKLQTLLSEREDIDSLFFYDGIPIADYNLKNIKNIHFFHKGEIYHDKTFFIPINLNKEQNFYIHIDDPYQYIIDEYQSIAPVNLNIIPSKIGRCYSISLIDRVKTIQNSIDLEKYKKLENYKNILWYGKNHFNRKEILRDIESFTKLKIKEMYVDFTKQSLIDVMIENECFCVLSLDGSVNQCHRDIELGLSRVFNLKYTNAQFDISANGGIYLARSLEELLTNIEHIHHDIINRDYNKLNKAFNFFSNTTNIYNITKPFICKHDLQHYSLRRLEALSNSLSLNINDLIESASNIKTFEEWKSYVDKFFN